MSAASDFDLLSSEVVEDPYPFYAWLREHAPIHEVPGTGVHLVAKRHLIEEVLDREEDFSANLTGVLITGTEGSAEVFELTRFGTSVDAIANADEPSHTIHRKLVLPHVTPRGIAALEGLFRSWAVELMTPLLEAGHGDWIEHVANPLPTRAMCRVVGLPLEDADRLLGWAMAGTEILAGTTTLEQLGRIGEQTAEMTRYLHDRLQEAVAAPTDSPAKAIVGELARGVREGLITLREGASILVVLAGAGGESTSSLTGNSVRILAEQPDLQSKLRADPGLIPNFVEEAVRLESSFRGHYRVVKRDTTLDGVALSAGSRVLLLWAAANRDPEQFERPDEVDVHRKNAREHLAFGRGNHFCVGARLARLEAKVILEELLARTDSFGLDRARPPRYAPSIFVRRHAELELRLAPTVG